MNLEKRKAMNIVLIILLSFLFLSVFSLKGIAKSTIYDTSGVPLMKIAGDIYYHPLDIGFAMEKEYKHYNNAKSEQEKNIAKTKLFKYADWAVNTPIRNDYGNWSTWSYNFAWGDYRPGWVSAMANAAIGNGLVYAWKVTGNETYLKTAQEAFRAFAVDYKNGGVLYEFSMDSWWYLEYAQNDVEPSMFVLNGFMYALKGVHDYEKLTQDYQFHFLWEKGLKALKERIKYYDSPDLKWSQYLIGGSTPASTDYHMFHVLLLEDFYTMTDDPFLKDYLEKWREYYVTNYPFYIFLYKVGSDRDVPMYQFILRHSSLGPPNPYEEEEYSIYAETNITFANGSVDSLSLNLEDYKKNLFNLSSNNTDISHLPVIFVNKTIVGHVSKVSVFLYMKTEFRNLFIGYYEPPIYQELLQNGSIIQVDSFTDNKTFNISTKVEHFGSGIALNTLTLPTNKFEKGQIRYRIKIPKEMHTVYENVMNFEQPESLNNSLVAYDAQNIELNSEIVAEGKFAGKIFINSSLIYTNDINNYQSNQGRIVFDNVKINASQLPYLFFQFRPEAPFRSYAIDIYMQNGQVYSRYFTAEPFKWNKILLSWLGFGYFKPGAIDKIAITIFTLGLPSGSVYIDDIRVLKSPLFVEPLAEGIFTSGEYTYVDVSKNKSTIQWYVDDMKDENVDCAQLVDSELSYYI